MNAIEAVGLIEEDVNHAPQDAVVYAISRARLAKAVQLALDGSRRMAKSILDAEAETGLIGCRWGNYSVTAGNFSRSDT